MTIRIPAVILLSVALVIVSGLVAFGVALAVSEWRESGSDYIDCITQVEEGSLDASETLRAARPVSPDPPGAGGSQAAFDAYHQQFTQYRAEHDKWIDRSDDIHRGWLDDMRACSS